MKTPIVGMALVCLIFASGCAKLVFVSDRDGNAQIYKMRSTGASQRNISNNSPYSDSFPDVSPDGEKIVFSSIRNGLEKIIVREIDDSDGSGSTEQILTESAPKKIRPRWSCQQDLIAFAEFTSSNQAKIFLIRADGGGAPIQVTAPTGSQSDSGGHDFFENGNKIVFSRSNSTGGTYDLYYKNSDGTGTPQPITATSVVNEILPAVSHDGNLLAYLSYYMLASGWPEMINIVNVDTWTPFSQIVLQAPIGGRRIGAIAFSDNDERLYVATKSADVSATPETKRYEIFSIKLNGSDLDRLTNNQWFDSHPSAIPLTPAPPCTRCVDVQNMPPTPSTQEITHNSVVFKAAILPSGSSTDVSVRDYCPSGDGINELRIGWSQTNAGAAEYATINFPSALFGDGPSEVEVTACHYNSLRLNAYDKNGNLVDMADHTTGQNTLQTLTLNGGNISRIDVVGAEIGIREICYRR